MSKIPNIARSKPEVEEDDIRVPVRDMAPLELVAHEAGADIFGLKCDAPGCGWSESNIPVDAYPLYLGAACPECGENVLTGEDFTMMMSTVFAFVGAKYSEEVGLDFPAILQPKKERMH